MTRWSTDRPSLRSARLNLRGGHGETTAAVGAALGFTGTLPKEWAGGSVRGLRARSGFEVDAAWADGKLISATIRSNPGPAGQVRCAGQLPEFNLQPGQARISGPNW